MSEESNENQSGTGESKPRRGGARRNAGRPHRDVDLWLKARGLTHLTAAQVIAGHGEQRGWHRLLNTEDDSVFCKAWLYLHSMRDGKPLQNVNVTNLTVNVSPDDIIAARSIARDVMGGINASGNPSGHDTLTLELSAGSTENATDSDAINKDDNSADDINQEVNREPYASGEPGEQK